MNYYCTHSDFNYLAKGVALFHSIKQNVTEKFKLYYLCLDQKTHDTLTMLTLRPGYENLCPISLNDIFDEDELNGLKNLPACNYGDQYSQFCWALTPCFVRWLLLNKVAIPEKLLYCDADIYFYQNPQIIFDACDNHAVGIHRHRFRNYDENTNDVGEFNVGCVLFNSDFLEAYQIAGKWRHLLTNPNNTLAAKYGTCGDQKYWDWFYRHSERKNDICVFDPDDGNIAHGAPWNFNLYEFIGNNKVMYNGREQQLVFNHFSHFNADENGWRSSNHGEWKPEDHNDSIRTYYNHYYTEILKAKAIINENIL